MNCPYIQAGKCTLGVFQVVRSRTGGERGRKGKPVDKGGWASVLSGRCWGGRVSGTRGDSPAQSEELVGEHGK